MWQSLTIRSSHANSRYLLLFTNLDDAPQNILRLHLHDLSAQFRHQLEMIQQIPLTGQINSVHTLLRSLHIEGYTKVVLYRVARRAAFRIIRRGVFS